MKTKKSIPIKWGSKLKRSKIFYFLIAILTFNFCFLALFVGKASAQDTTLRISPSVLELKAVPPTTIKAPISVENLGDETTNLKIEFREFKSGKGQTGQIEYLPASSSGFLKNVAIIENTEPKTNISIGPRQKKNFILQININEEEIPSDHYFSVIFTRSDIQAPPNQTLNGPHGFTRINLAVAINILLSVNPSETSESPILAIEEFTAPRFVNKGPVEFTVKIQNKTSSYIKPKGSIYITNMFGQLIGKIDLPAQNILARSSRFIGSSAQLSDHKVTWDESFLLGFYDATIEIETEAGKSPLKSSIRFTAIPFKLILGIIIFAIVALTTLKRARARMASK